MKKVKKLKREKHKMWDKLKSSESPLARTMRLARKANRLRAEHGVYG